MLLKKILINYKFFKNSYINLQTFRLCIAFKKNLFPLKLYTLNKLTNKYDNYDPSSMIHDWLNHFEIIC